MAENVKLIGITQSKIPGIYTPEEFISYVARISNPANQMNTLTAKKLLTYLIDHKHWSPFEHVYATLEITTTRDISRQILRHGAFKFQEFSQRYAQVDIADFFVRHARLQDTKNRQNSIEVDDDDLDKAWRMKQQQVAHEAGMAYKWALENGIAKEQARVVLPEGLTKTTMFMTGNIRCWLHYSLVRTDKSTQKEHRIIAEECWDIIAREVPSLKNTIIN
tara:strand:- start:17066 stop:17725 length:660 start_codon:yes stop_codon:yes gene_type:complete